MYYLDQHGYVVSSDEKSVELQCDSSEFEYESGSSCDETYAKLSRPYQFEPYKSDVEEAEETSSVSVNGAIDTTATTSTTAISSFFDYNLICVFVFVLLFFFFLTNV